MLWVWLSKVRGSTGRCLRHLSPPPRSWAPHMGEVAHSEVSSMSNVRDSGGTDRESWFSHLSPSTGRAHTPNSSGDGGSGHLCHPVSAPCSQDRVG